MSNPTLRSHARPEDLEIIALLGEENYTILRAAAKAVADAPSFEDAVLPAAVIAAIIESLDPAVRVAIGQKLRALPENQPMGKPTVGH